MATAGHRTFHRRLTAVHLRRYRCMRGDNPMVPLHVEQNRQQVGVARRERGILCYKIEVFWPLPPLDHSTRQYRGRALPCRDPFWFWW